MKKIIDGKLYDTDSSDLIFKGYDITKKKQRDYYRTSKGTFFCHYVMVGKIELISDDVMMDILSEHDPDKYIEIFGSVEEG